MSREASHSTSACTEAELARLQKRRDANLRYFQQTFPAIYDYFKAYAPNSHRLSLSEQGGVNLLKEGLPCYLVDAVTAAQQEVAHFCAQYPAQGPFKTINPPVGDQYCCSRYFYRSMHRIIKGSPLKEGAWEEQGRFPSSIPLLVFMGCGLGYGIEALLKQRSAQHLILFEDQLERFYLSLYTVCWRTICEPYLQDPSRSIQFLFSTTTEREQNWRLLWNELLRYYPSFPIATLYLNHQNCSDYRWIITRINQEMPSSILGWGHYDDEVNQVNHALHSVNLGVTFIPERIPEAFQSVPVFVVGNGPSLDDRIEFLRRNRNKIVVVSSGSSITSLYRYGIKPDIHIVSESDYSEWEILASIQDGHYFSEIVLVGVMQKSPYIERLGFKASLSFLKRDGAASALLSHSAAVVERAGPTCTNAAFSFVARLGFKTIVCVGMDFGFKTLETHHSKKSLYYQASQPDLVAELAEIKSEQLLTLEGVDGEPLLTRPYYYMAKSVLQSSIESYQGQAEVINFSEGAKIEGAQWYSREALSERASLWPTCDQSQLISALISCSNKAHGYSLDRLRSEVECALKALGAFVEQLVPVIQQGVEQSTLVEVVTAVRNICERHKAATHPFIYSLVNGSIRHFLYLAMTHVIYLPDNDSKASLATLWGDHFIQFLTGLSSDVRKTLINKVYRVEDDPMLGVSIMQDVK